MEKQSPKIFSNAYAVIMAGGAGTRLWPLSRQGMPKQFQTFTDDNRTLLQATFDRLTNILPINQICILVTEQYVPEVKKQLPEILKENILIEPTGRNTAAATALASELLIERDENAIIALIPSDHTIASPEVFTQSLKLAFKTATAQPDYIISLGIEPTSPHTGYGYIKKGKNQESNDKKIYLVDKFVEKPNLETASRYYRSQKYLWNGGYYIFNARTMISAMRELAPEVITKVEKAAKANDNNKRLAIYQSIDKISLDYAVSEKYNKLLVIPVDMGWSDIGSWGSLHEVLKAASQVEGNFIKGDHIGIDTENVLVLGQDKLIATLGLKDIVIVDTPDVLLICHKNNEQDIKTVLEQLREQGREGLL